MGTNIQVSDRTASGIGRRLGHALAVIPSLALALEAGCAPDDDVLTVQLPADAEAFTTSTVQAVNFNCMDPFYGENPDKLDLTFQRMSEGGVRGVRMMLPWSRLQPQSADAWNSVQLARVDDCLRRAGVIGATTTFVFESTPTWASVNGVPQPAAVDGAIRSLIAHFRSVREQTGNLAMRVYAWEIYNETNVDRGPNPYWPGTAAQYVDVLKAASRAVRVDGHACVVLAGIADVRNLDDPSTTHDEAYDYSSEPAPAAYLSKLCQLGACGTDPATNRPYFDIAALHEYPMRNVAARTSAAALLQPVTELHQVLPDRPVWIGEFAWLAADNDIASLLQQAALLRTAFAYLADKPYLGWATWFPIDTMTTDDGSNSDTGQRGYSLLLADWGARPSLEALHSTSNSLLATDDVGPSAIPTIHYGVERRRIDLQWTAPSDASGISGYRVYLSQGTSGPYTLVGLPTTTQTRVEGLTPGTTYRIAVAAVDSAGNISTTPTGPYTFTTAP